MLFSHSQKLTKTNFSRGSLAFRFALVLSFIFLFAGVFYVKAYFDTRTENKVSLGASHPVPVLSKEKEASILFVGDAMFDRAIRSIGEREGYDYLFSCIESELEDFDVAVLNLEGPVTKNKSTSQGTAVGAPGNTNFTFDPKVLKSLVKNNFRIVNIGNNHIYDKGPDGLTSTRSFLRSSDIYFFGDPESERFKALYASINGIPLVFLNYNEWFGDDFDILNSRIEREAKSGRLVVVYTHWGDEYVEVPGRIRDIAHSFVDSGADLIIGSHPHVIQEVEEYSGVKIFYSLGNFIFDQWWEEAVSTGLGVALKITEFEGKYSLSFDEILFDIAPNGQTCLK